MLNKYYNFIGSCILYFCQNVNETLCIIYKGIEGS